MRVDGQDGGLSARAIAGSHVVLLAMDMAQDEADGLLGFALHRADRGSADGEWLPNFLRFEQNANDEGHTLSSENPIQAFVWGDYTVDPGSRLTYRVETRYGSPSQMEARHTVELEVDVESADDGRHGIFFNRGAAGSQAYSEKFHDVSPLDDPKAAAWLSRGLEEALLEFIRAARGRPDVALRGAFYEFKHPSVLEELAKAAEDGVDVSLVVARPDPDAHGNEKYPGEDNVDPVHESNLDGHVTWRRHCGGIPHNKFLLLLEGGTPTAVWTGSTNITDGALYGQSNVGHLVHGGPVAAAYLQYWNDLVGDPQTEDLRDVNTQHNALPDSELPDPGIAALFSPHHGTKELEWFGELMRRPDNQAVFFTAPFGIGSTFEEALKAPHPFPIYVLLDKGDNNMELLRAVPGNELTAGAFLGHGRWRQFLEEKLQDKLNPNVKFVHTKYMLVNPLSDDPIVISGSANFSPASVSSNDENMLVIRGDTRVADIYLGEFMRLFTHMYFRAKVTGDKPAGDTRAPTAASRGDTTPLFLSADSSWTGEWYDQDGPKKRERELFALT
jgi:phosphatidylserine/phosphatidylglycerophosphate/cardiolipin synthase-like enzyme